jgi:ATP-binding cassette subfamily B (MDR/TAP) protein 1
MKADHDEDEVDPASIELEDAPKVANSWKALFTFTDRLHLLVLLPCLLLSTFAGVLRPAQSILFGKFFNTLSDFGAGKIDCEELTTKGLVEIYGLLAVGGAMWLLKGGYFCTWLIFGELQAKGARDELFQNLLEKDLGWFESRSSGVASVLSRLQT